MRRADLEADCARCDALCCVVTSFEASEDFAVDKPAGVACPHLTRELHCSIHTERSRRGFSGCCVYDCYGAGPHATRLYPGSSAAERDAMFLVLRDVHEWLWLLSEAEKLCPATHQELRTDLRARIESIDALAALPATTLLALDREAQQRAARSLLRQVGEAIGGRRGLPAQTDSDRRSLPLLK